MPKRLRILTWLLRFVLVLIPFVVVCGLYAPKGIQFLNPLVCEPGQHLDQMRDDRSEVRGPTGHIDLVCLSDTRAVNASGKVTLSVVVLAALALATYEVRRRSTRPPLSGPSGPGSHSH
jgi:hypothetical protein